MVLSRIIHYYPTRWFYLGLMDVLMEQSNCKHFMSSPICCSSNNPYDHQFWLLAHVYLPLGRWLFLLCPSSSRTNFLFLHAFHAHSCLKGSLFHLNFCVIYCVFPYLVSYHIIQFLAECLNLPKRLQVPPKQTLWFVRYPEPSKCSINNLFDLRIIRR